MKFKNIFLLFFFLLLSVGENYSAKDKPVAIIVKISGKVIITRMSRQIRAELYMPLYLNDKIKTFSQGSVEIIFDTGVCIKIDENCELEVKNVKILISEHEEKPNVDIVLNLFRGGVLTDANLLKNLYELKSVKVLTPTATAAVRGTMFYTEVTDDDTTTVAVFTGEVETYMGKIEEPEEISEEKYPRVILATEQQTTISYDTVVPPVSKLSYRMKEYRDTVVKKFIKNVQYYREHIDKLKRSREEWIRNKKVDFEKRIEERKRQFYKKDR